MVGDDLFPRDFIYALDAPTNYIGASRIFGDDDSLDCLRSINDGAETFPRGLKSTETIDTIPNSLVDAVHCFVLANAIMDGRGATPKHRSMLVNVSHFSLIQDQVKEIVDGLLRDIQRDIRNYSSLPTAEALRNRTISTLYNIFQREYRTVDLTWDVVQNRLTAASLPIEVRSVNQNAGPASLDYSQYKQNGLRVIAVGGNSLSRGLTLEGLVISYFHRHTQMYDALLQMGRWFGYRTGYEDIFRIWMTDEAINWYRQVAEATDELRDEIRIMQNSKLKPIDFGLKVRSHPESLLITARNKMYHTEQIIRSITISEEAVETARIFLDANIIEGNFRSTQRIIREILESSSTRSTQAKYLWKNVPKKIISDYLRAFAAHPLNVNFQPRDLADFIEHSSEQRLDEWDVIIPEGDGDESICLDAGTINVRMRRRKVDVERDVRALLINGDKMRVGSRGDEKAGMEASAIALAEKDFWADADNSKKKSVPDRAYRSKRERPLLIIHMIEGRESSSVGGATIYQVPANTALVALGLSFPRLAVGSRSVTYRINLVELRNMLREEIDNSDEEDDDDVDTP
jgi:hypothetical protein